MKTLEDYFRDWEAGAFGFGYGSGEMHILTALKTFLGHCNEGDRGCSYSFDVLEDNLTPTVAWLLINALLHDGLINYGTSPRYAWLEEHGIVLRDFVAKHTVEELYDILFSYDENYIPCMKDVCNCGSEGYQKGVVCPNPFWHEKMGRGLKSW